MRGVTSQGLGVLKNSAARVYLREYTPRSYPSVQEVQEQTPLVQEFLAPGGRSHFQGQGPYSYKI